jgi:hypothetical protein
VSPSTTKTSKSSVESAGVYHTTTLPVERKTGTSTAAATTTTTTTTTTIEVFEESDRLFEQRFSATALAAGLRMAYLPALLFEHTGEDVSAYVLNEMKRPWDKTITNDH